MRVALAALLLAPVSALPQETKLEDVVALMEKRAEGLRDVRFRLDVTSARMMGLPGRLEVIVTSVRGAGVRVRASCEAPGAAAGAAGLYPRTAEYIYTPEAFIVLQEWGGDGQGSPFPLQAVRLRRDDPALRNHDPFLLPRGNPARMMFDEPLLYTRLAPRMFLAFEPNLSLAGRRSEGGRTWFVLASAPGAPDPKLPRPATSFETLRKEFFVDAATGALERLRWELSMRMDMAGTPFEQKMVLESEARGELALGETRTLPRSVRWTMSAEAMRMAQKQEIVRHLEGARANEGLGASEIATEAERNDLYADALLRAPEEYEARVRKDPRDAAAQVSLAAALGAHDPFAAMMKAAGGAGAKPDFGPAVRALEKAVELRPDAESAVLNLLAAYGRTEEAEGEKRLLERIEKGELKGERVRLRAARRLVATGGLDRASKLLEGLAPAAEGLRREAVLERMVVAAARGEEGEIGRLFAGEAGRRSDTAGKIALVEALEDAYPRVPEAAKKILAPEKALELLAAGEKARPGELAYRIARASVHRHSGKPLSAALELLEAAPSDAEIVGRALEALDTYPESSAEEHLRLAAALGRAGGGDLRLRLAAGRALRAGGNEGEGRKKFEEALEACRGREAGGDPGAAVRVALALASEGGPEGWRERCVEAVLENAQEGGSLPYELWMDESKNPIVQQAKEYLGKKEWMKYYRLMVRANRAAGMPILMIARQGELPKEALESIKRDVLSGKEAPRVLELADFLEGLGRVADAVDALEKAHALAPKDAGILRRLAKAAADAGTLEKARAAYEALFPELEGEARSEARLELAEAYLQRKDAAKAREVLAKVDLAALRQGTVLRAVSALGEAQDGDRGIEACRRAYELGLRPHFQMGRFLEKKKDYVEALRYYNRDRSEPSSAPGLQDLERVMRRQILRVQRGEGQKQEEEEPVDGGEARERLLGKLGPDYLLTRFLEQKLDPLPPAEEKRVRAMVERLSSEGIDERDAGLEELRKYGAKAAPFLKHFLKSGDEEVKTRVKQLLLEWAEPK